MLSGINNNNSNTNYMYGSGDIHNNNQIINNQFNFSSTTSEDVSLSHVLRVCSSSWPMSMIAGSDTGKDRGR